MIYDCYVVIWSRKMSFMSQIPNRLYKPDGTQKIV